MNSPELELEQIRDAMESDADRLKIARLEPPQKEMLADVEKSLRSKCRQIDEFLAHHRGGDEEA